MKGYQNIPTGYGLPVNKALTQDQKVKIGRVIGYYHSIIEKALEESRPMVDTKDNSLACADLADGLMITLEETFSQMFDLLQQNYCDFARLRKIALLTVIERLCLTDDEIEWIIKNEEK